MNKITHDEAVELLRKFGAELKLGAPVFGFHTAKINGKFYFWFSGGNGNVLITRTQEATVKEFIQEALRKSAETNDGIVITYGPDNTRNLKTSVWVNGKREKDK